MQRTLTFLGIVFILVAEASNSSIVYAQQKPKISAKEETLDKHKSVYACPMHKEVTSGTPGKCPKCGMSLVLHELKDKARNGALDDSTASGKIERAKSLLAEAKRDLAQEGNYNCCIKDPCDRCALDHESCPCAEDVKKGKSVCPDCYAGWQRGDGIVKGVKPSDVKASFHSHHKH